MKERYPFFRDETERSLAVIGESGIESDLNGQFERSYAILTEKHLYCKNEIGNFIADVDQIQGTKFQEPRTMPLFGWLAFVFGALPVVLWGYLFRTHGGGTQLAGLFMASLLLFGLPLLTVKWVPKVGLIFLTVQGVISLLAAFKSRSYGQLKIIILVASVVIVVVCIASLAQLFMSGVGNGGSTFEIKHSTGVFVFREKDYPPEELAAFSQAVSDLKDTSV